MNFANLLFLFVFLPICIGAYIFSGNIRTKNNILIIFSLVFYAWGEPIKLILLLLSAVVNFLLARSIDANRGNKLCKTSLIIALVYNVGMLGIFKYTDFLIDNFNNLFGTQIHAINIALPLGISFYTFQILSYIIDVYWDNIPVQKDFSKLLLYISLFPQLVAGPIVRYSTIAEEIDDRHTSLTDLSEGLTRLIVGLSKKVLLSNILALLADAYLGDMFGASSVLATWTGVISYSMQIYFDFSGYSDMAIGMGRIFGFHFNENFNYPFMCRSIQEFWQRWHISLGSFFRDYLLYLPIFGKRRQWLSLFLVWFTTGLWHGASWNFIAWGLYFGLFIFIEQKLGKKRLKKIPNAVMHIYNKIVILIGFGIFYYDNGTTLSIFFKTMKYYFGNLFGFTGHGFFNKDDFLYGHVSSVIRENVSFAKYAFIFFIALIACFPIVPKVKQLISKQSTKVQAVTQIASAFGCIALLVCCMIFLVASKNNPFVYFRF